MTAQRRALVGWVLFAALAMGLASPPPEPPTESLFEKKARSQAVAVVVREVKRWQREQGDRTLAWDEAKGHLAIVIDDVGRELVHLEALLALRYPLTFSILPGSVYAAGAQLRLLGDRRRPRDVLLHLPMEPHEGRVMHEGREAEEAFLRVDDPPASIRSKVEAALLRVPTAIGVNNHMGSRFTEDAPSVAQVLQVLAGRGLVVLDSRTSPATVFEAEARARGLITLRRHVFLDPAAACPDCEGPSPADDDVVRSALAAAAERALREPTIAIGHPVGSVVRVLEDELPGLFDRGIAVFPLSAFAARAEASAQASAQVKAEAPGGPTAEPLTAPGSHP